jgi:hypothetical protein
MIFILTIFSAFLKFFSTLVTCDKNRRNKCFTRATVLLYNITSKLCNPVLGQLKSFKNSFFLFYLVSE